MAKQSAFAGNGIYGTPVLKEKSNLISREWAKQFSQLAAQLIAPVGLVAPATSASAGTPGMIATDGTYLYICTALNTWKRITLVAF